MFTILQKELNAFFSSLTAYVIIGFFLLLTGLWMWVFPDTNVLDGDYADMQIFFRSSPYLFMFLVPAITMHTFTEEKSVGTLEMLLTTPLSLAQIILGKYFASLIIILLILIFTSTYYFSVYHLGSPPGNVDTAAVVGAYMGLMLLAAVFTAVGILASSLTQRQIVAFLLGVLLCVLLYQGFDAWTTLQTWKSYSLLIAQIGIHYHYEALSRGVIDTRDLLYFFSTTIIFLVATGLGIHYKR